MTNKDKGEIRISVRISPELKAQLNKAKDDNFYMTMSECLRSAIRIGVNELNKHE